MNTKENRAGNQQPYIPKGNGDISGEYTDDDVLFTLNEQCTEKQLRDLLTHEEYIYVKRYSNTTVGKRLNRGIRNNSLTVYGKRMCEKIITAINKHSLINELTLFRGISVTPSVFINEFYKAYINKEVKIGSLICSTSRTINRAIKCSFPEKGNIALVFEVKVPKGYKCLPIESIGSDSKEKEVLMTKPIYKILSITNWHLGTFRFKKIIIELERN